MKRLWLIVPLLWAACASPDEKAIRSAIDKGVSAAERKDAVGILALLSPDFSGPEGIDKEGFRRLIEDQFRFRERVRVAVSGLKLRLGREIAEVSMSVQVAESPAAMIGQGRTYQVDSSWSKKGGRWLIVRASWYPTS